MSLKKYTITAEGQTSNGNPLEQPFTVEVHQITTAKDSEYTDLFSVVICAINGSGESCEWDGLKSLGFASGTKNYDGAPSMESSNNVNLAATLEVDLEVAAPSKWS